MVRRIPGFCKAAREGKVQVRASHLGGTRPAGLATSLVLDARVRQCARVRAIFAGPRTCLWLPRQTSLLTAATCTVSERTSFDGLTLT